MWKRASCQSNRDHSRNTGLPRVRRGRRRRRIVSVDSWHSGRAKNSRRLEWSDCSHLNDNHQTQSLVKVGTSGLNVPAAEASSAFFRHCLYYFTTSGCYSSLARSAEGPPTTNSTSSESLSAFQFSKSIHSPWSNSSVLRAQVDGKSTQIRLTYPFLSTPSGIIDTKRVFLIDALAYGWLFVPPLLSER